MKLVLVTLALIGSFGLSAFAGEEDYLDGTPSAEVARSLAFDFASDEVFGNLLDHDSSVVIVSRGDDANAFYFLAMLDSVCTVEITVSKETGLAFNDNPMVCTKDSGY